MEIVHKFNRTYVSWKDQFNRIPNIQVQIYGKSGSQKGMFSEGLCEVWQYLTKGIVIWLVDPKKEVEGSYASYQPEEFYQLNRLKMDGMVPRTHETKLYHPFTFNIPDKKYLPDINFYTIPIKALGDSEFGILAETDFESETVKLMERARDNLLNDGGIYTFLHDIERLTEGSKSKKHPIREPENFYLKSGVGTAKSVAEASNCLRPFFYNDYFLSKENSKYNLNWKEILNDNSCYHVFFTKWLDPLSEKVHGFVALSLLNQIIRNLDYSEKPVLLVIPEVLFLCPEYVMGWPYFLGKAFEKAFITMRGKGRGVSSIVDSQSWDKTSKKITGSGVITFFGKLNPGDLERICKARNYNKQVREMIVNLKVNEFLFVDNEDQGIFRAFLPRHMHKEEKYNWIEMYKRKFRSKLKRYNELRDTMSKEYKSEENNIIDKIKLDEKKQKDEKEKEEKEQIDKSTQGKKLTEEIKKTKTKKQELDNTKKKLILDYLENPNVLDNEKSERKVAKKFEISRPTVHKIFIEHRSREGKDKEVTFPSDTLDDEVKKYYVD